MPYRNDTGRFSELNEVTQRIILIQVKNQKATVIVITMGGAIGYILPFLLLTDLSSNYYCVYDIYKGNILDNSIIDTNDQKRFKKK